MRQNVSGLVYVLFLLLTIGCDNQTQNPESETTVDTDTARQSECPRPDGWDDASHSTSGAPNYDAVFPKNKVNRIDIAIAKADWQAMLDDLAVLTASSRTPTTPSESETLPPFLVQPCAEKTLRDTCDFIQGMQGVCILLGGETACLPLYAEEGGGDAMINGKPIWVPSTVTFEDKTWHHVGIRFKGNASLSFTYKAGVHKLPLRFDFDQYEDENCSTLDQRFFGFKRLTLSNNYGDDSSLHEKVATEIFREAGVPAPYAAFYRVFVDVGEGPTYFGIYTMVEVPAKPLFERAFGDKDGNLYKPEGTSASWNSFSEVSFGKRTNEVEGDWSDISSAVNALHASRADPKKWRADLESVFYVEGFLRWLAVNTVIQNWDTYGNMVQNYYLYTSTSDGLVHWIPWDNNEAFKDGGMFPALSLSQDEVTEFFPLIRLLVDDPVYKAQYISFVEAVISGPYETTRAKARFSEAMDLVRPYITGEEGEQAGYTLLESPSDLETEFQRLLTQVDQRTAAVTQFLAEGE